MPISSQERSRHNLESKCTDVCPWEGNNPDGLHRLGASQLERKNKTKLRALWAGFADPEQWFFPYNQSLRKQHTWVLGNHKPETDKLEPSPLHPGGVGAGAHGAGEAEGPELAQPDGEKAQGVGQYPIAAHSYLWEGHTEDGTKPFLKICIGSERVNRQVSTEQILITC